MPFISDQVLPLVFGSSRVRIENYLKTLKKYPNYPKNPVKTTKTIQKYPKILEILKGERLLMVRDSYQTPVAHAKATPHSLIEHINWF